MLLFYQTPVDSHLLIYMNTVSQLKMKNRTRIDTDLSHSSSGLRIFNCNYESTGGKVTYPLTRYMSNTF